MGATHLSFLSCCCDRALLGKQPKGERGYSDSQSKTQTIKTGEPVWREVNFANHTNPEIRNREPLPVGSSHLQ